MRRPSHHIPLLVIATALVSGAAIAQVGPAETPADTGSGIVGQRQTREEAPGNTAPLDRIESRIANRVQSRLRTRIDRNYDPKANATSPFEAADDQARTAGRKRR